MAWGIGRILGGGVRRRGYRRVARGGYRYARRRVGATSYAARAAFGRGVRLGRALARRRRYY